MSRSAARRQRAGPDDARALPRFVADYEFDCPMAAQLIGFDKMKG